MVIFSNYYYYFGFSPGKSIGVSSILLGLVLVGRAAFVFPLSSLSNLTKKFSHEKLNLEQQVRLSFFFRLLFFNELCLGKITLFLQVTIWWAGLMRGAVSMALAYNQVSYIDCF